MSRMSTLVSGRRFEESGMTDTCQIGEEVEGELDEATGVRATTINAVYEGKCMWTATDIQANEIDVVGQQLVDQDAVLKLPALTSTAVEKGHVIIITASQTDPALVGVKARIVGPFASAYATSRRFPVKRVS